MRIFAMVVMAIILAGTSGTEASNSTYSVGYQYNAQGRVIKTRLNLPNGRTLYTDYFYAPVLVRARVMDSAGVLVAEYVYVRDSRGRLLTKVIRNSLGTQVGRVHLDYDTLGRINTVIVDNSTAVPVWDPIVDK